MAADTLPRVAPVLSAAESAHDIPTTAKHLRLSEREQRVWDLRCLGVPRAEAAAQLGLTVRAYATYLHSARVKLGHQVRMGYARDPKRLALDLLRSYRVADRERA